ncbi:glycosyltransferase [Paraglaciecola psychrophila]|uniref:Glycosyl transferase family 1 domain-containing protein n=1 Tax=Paraglaciecola psychrophila 170 TaxID=1129794 RepID=K7ADX9_9ALTE|nr:glycosyltransferase [Paraglaciecola psychrophila]AGH43160.1 hypothetical protein C427_1051 [Paraglaciecola psychrophila 170]GAC38838.1 hypothetical protein GPSY_3227 [Paraglaciecola psychrophila 170]
MIFLLDLPKPIHGMSVVNKAFIDKVSSEVDDYVVINTAPSYAANYFNGILWIIVKFFHTIFCCFKLFYNLSTNTNKSVYRSINGGWGQCYDVFYILIVRAFSRKIYIHHHSFSYLNNTSNIFKIVKIITGNKVTHIVLSNHMADILSSKYGVEKINITIISNLFSFDDAENNYFSKPVEKVNIGYLSNIQMDKGIDAFIDVCRTLNSLNFNFTAKIAGPFSDDVSKKIVIAAVKEMAQITYMAPLYTEGRVNFYKSLDCFVFPSRYRYEAEPLVLYEAAMYGIYILGTRQGCMEEVIEKMDGTSFVFSTNMAQEIAATIKDKFESNCFSTPAKNRRIEHIKKERIKATSALIKLVKEINIV